MLRSAVHERPRCRTASRSVVRAGLFFAPCIDDLQPCAHRSLAACMAILPTGNKAVQAPCRPLGRIGCREERTKSGAHVHWMRHKPTVMAPLLRGGAAEQSGDELLGTYPVRSDMVLQNIRHLPLRAIMLRDVGLGHYPATAAGAIDDRHAPDLLIFHDLGAVGEIRLTRHGDARRTHHVALLHLERVLPLRDGAQQISRSVTTPRGLPSSPRPVSRRNRVPPCSPPLPAG